MSAESHLTELAEMRGASPILLKRAPGEGVTQHSPGLLPVFCNVNPYRFSKTLVKYYHTSENFPGVTCRSGYPLFYATVESCTDIYHEPSKFLLPYSFVYWSFLLYSKLFVDRGRVFFILVFLLPST